MNSKWRKRFLLIAILIAIVVVLRFTVFSPKPLEISAYKVKKGTVEETVTNSKAGTVKSRKRAKLSPEMGGKVVYLGAKEGERVRTGQVLLRLDDSELKASVTLSERGVQASNAAMKEACLAAQLAQREYQRNQSLNSKGIVSDAVLDQIANQRDVANARCEATRSEAKRAEASLSVSKAGWKKTELTAPFDGVIAQLSTELGEWITPSPPGVPIPPVIDVIDTESIYIEAPIDETDAGRLKARLPVRISLDPFPRQTFSGIVARIAPFVQDIEGQNRTVDIEAEFEDKQFSQKLLPGTSADVEIILNSRSNVLRIPAYAMMEGNRVLVVQNEKLVAHTVTTGLRNWEFIEIQGGLKEGDLIAVSLELAEVKEGADVKVKEVVQ